jgi:hypothetical protein
VNAEQWRRVRVLFDVAGQLAAAQRRAFLRNACAEEPELRQEVESLLAAAAEAGDFLEAGALNDITWPPVSAAGATLPELTPPVADAATEAAAPRSSGAFGKLREAVRRRLGKPTAHEP